MNKFLRRKGQSSAEYVIIVSWVIVILAVLYLGLNQMGAFNPVPCDEQIYGFSEIVPSDWAFYPQSSQMVLSLENNGGEDAEINSISADLEDVVCVNNTEIIIPPGENILVSLNCTPPNNKPIGTCYKSSLIIGYSTGKNHIARTEQGVLSGEAEARS